ncbi:SDR family oxidoreductase [uncultured Algibacter sp.]|uniref:SDR family oxidoreductase n=1 Tax=uncultured Algibacter sp. TaxID=298659 RepID=UPI002639633C|nr:SDR family oxidoreductase [uncultured Algibacter sp.]
MISQELDLKILVTGANRGLGLGFVNYYLNKGCQVIACIRNIDKSLYLNSLFKLHKDNLQIEILDVSKETSLTHFSKKVESLKFDIVINNAGICIEQNLGSWSSNTFEDIFKTNTIGVALFSQIILPLIKPHGKLINISSGLGSIALNINPEIGLDAYAMSKAALNSFSRRLANKVQSKKIIVLALSPGWVKTDMGGEEATLTIDEAIFKLGIVIEKLTLKDNGKFLSENGEELPW